MMIDVTRRCPMCGKISSVSCDRDAWRTWESGGCLIQEAFPDMDIHTRETLISGMCLPCQESFFVEDEDDCDGECDTCPNYSSNVDFAHCNGECMCCSKKDICAHSDII